MSSWKPRKKDMIFLSVVILVVLALVMGSTEHTTKATPNDITHQQALSRTACISCHNADGVKPQPLGHTKADQCFQCHQQPDAWQGAK